MERKPLWDLQPRSNDRFRARARPLAEDRLKPQVWCVVGNCFRRVLAEVWASRPDLTYAFSHVGFPFLVASCLVNRIIVSSF